MSVGFMPPEEDRPDPMPGFCRDGSFTAGLLMSLIASPMTCLYAGPAAGNDVSAQRLSSVLILLVS